MVPLTGAEYRGRMPSSNLLVGYPSANRAQYAAGLLRHKGTLTILIVGEVFLRRVKRVPFNPAPIEA